MANLQIIKEVLDREGINVKDFAKQIGLSHQALYKMIDENSTRINTLEKISEILKIPIQKFFENPEDRAEEGREFYNKLVKVDGIVSRLEDVTHRLEKLEQKRKP